MAEINKPDMTDLWAQAGAVLTPTSTKVQTGWTAEIPPHQWENWVQRRQDEALAYLFQHGVAIWDATTEYFVGRSIVQSGGNLYVALTNNTNSDPASNPNDWKPVVTTASTSTTGTVTLASAVEVIAGNDNTKVVTPSTLSTLSSSETRRGLVELATLAESTLGTDTTRAVTPAGLQARIGQIPTASTSTKGLIQLATGTEAQSWANTTSALTPSTLKTGFMGPNVSLNINGFQRLPSGLIIQWFRNKIGMLDQNGQLILVITYPVTFTSAIFGSALYAVDEANNMGQVDLTVRGFQPQLGTMPVHLQNGVPNSQIAVSGIIIGI